MGVRGDGHPGDHWSITEPMGGPLKTYSLAEVAALVLPPEWTDGERWLARRLNRNEIRGYRVGRIWRMTEEHLREFIESRSNTVSAKADSVESARPVDPVSIAASLSPRGRSRLLPSSQPTPSW